MIHLELSGFVHPYDHLNGPLNLRVTKLDILRAMSTVGNDGFEAVIRNLGINRLIQRIFQCWANVGINSNGVYLKPKFKNLDQSEKSTESYLVAQALTKLVAEKLFDIPFLFHTKQFANVVFGGPTAPKRIICPTVKDGREPDLLGYNSAQEWFVFEAKGRSGNVSDSLRQKAINQVSKVSTINGQQPRCRIACAFELSKTPIFGFVDDPPGESSSVHYEFEPLEYFRSYYQSLLFRQLPNVPKTYFGFDLVYIGHRDKFNFGIDRKIYNSITSQNPNVDLITDRARILSRKINDFSENMPNWFSMGPDGVGFWERGM